MNNPHQLNGGDLAKNIYKSLTAAYKRLFIFVNRESIYKYTILLVSLFLINQADLCYVIKKHSKHK